MLSAIFERRVKMEEGYKLHLEIPEKEYLNVYEDVNEKAASEILQQFLAYHQDDGRVEEIKIKHDRNNHTVNIHTHLNYLGNDHTAQVGIPNHLRYYESKREH
ncbi:hypothetical protein Amet_3059 [Alkaliphilus metalliredigens QYMF]|uniref:Uncharacterized protein n=1 Tax=Alkaliphilus metalliredigens (strain QYMF) TaxID=293826 RepID=A6TSN1_ALKMQ|nr:hypothetical protein [Alkaliphilus metalliredigens]ABR49199.1 hypothetical protein Amet_3059 [Alkaliphilus metalliredigens QYMF]